MKNLLVKCIENFLIYIIFKNLNDVIVINFIIESPFHINFLNLLHGFYINHMFRDIHKLTY